MNTKMSLLAICVMFAVMVSAQAKSDQVEQSNEKAQLYRVEDGVFSLTHGETIDLTDRFVLMAFHQEPKCPRIVVNGISRCIEIGQRWDLKRRNNPFSLGALFEDKQRCFLDVVDIDAPKGADATATFRLHCI